jgi:hypothetical protein
MKSQRTNQEGGRKNLPVTGRPSDGEKERRAERERGEGKEKRPPPPRPPTSYLLTHPQPSRSFHSFFTNEK